MSDSFELVEGMEELYFGADQVSIPGPSTTWNHMCMNLRMVRMPKVLDPLLR